MSDASAAAALDTTRFVVADDESNVLRVFDRGRPGLPVATVDLTGFLAVTDKAPETDIEGAVRVGDRIYWITSHARNANGKERPNRQRFFATRITTDSAGPSLEPLGKPYRGLLDDLLGDPRLARFDLASASQKAPKQPGAFNIEGLTAMPDGGLLIGFRNPIPGGSALLVPMTNPETVIGGAPPKFGDPILLDLGGLGVRAISFERDRYVIIAGPFNGEGACHLYQWRGPGHAPIQVDTVHFDGFKPEAALLSAEADGLRCEIISDDGTLLIDGVPAKKLADPARRTFRTLTVHLGPQESARGR